MVDSTASQDSNSNCNRTAGIPFKLQAEAMRPQKWNNVTHEYRPLLTQFLGTLHTKSPIITHKKIEQKTTFAINDKAGNPFLKAADTWPTVLTFGKARVGINLLAGMQIQFFMEQALNPWDWASRNIPLCGAAKKVR